MTGRATCLLIAGLAAVAGLGGQAAPERDGRERPYRILDGKVDPATYNGYRRYHASCSHCHGPDGLGSSFGPSLVDAPLDLQTFLDAVLNGSGSGTSVMRGFAGDPNIEPYVSDLFAYLAARADGALGRGRPQRAD